MKRIFVAFVFALVIMNSFAQWRPVSGPYLQSEFVGMDFSEIKVEEDLLYAIINNLVYLSYNKGNSWMYASGVDPINAFKIACSGPNVYIGTSGNGVYWSKNYGFSYQNINYNLPKESTVYAILTTDSVLVAAIQSYDSVWTNEVYISDNNGKVWTVSNGLSGKFTKCLVADGTNLYAGTMFGVYKSVDQGKNWDFIGLENESIYALAAKDNLIFASNSSSNGLLYVTSDNGENWKAFNNDALKNCSFPSIAITDDHIYLAAGWDGAFRSDDNGDNWTKIITGSADQIVQVIASDSNTIFAGYHHGFVTSTNNGISWNHDINTFNLDIRSVAIAGSNLMTTTDNGIYISPDGGLNWNRIYYDMNILETVDSIVYIGGDNGFFRTTDYGKKLIWQNIYGLPDHPKFTDIVASRSMAFASLYGHGIYFSNDFGWNWSVINNGLTTTKLSGLTLTDSTLFAASEDKGVFRSDDFGLNWISSGKGLVDTTVTCLSSYSDNIFAGTNSYGIFRSIDKGDNWEQIQNEFSNSKILCLYSYGTNVFAGVEGKGFYMSANNGTDWLAYNTGLLNHNINSIAENDSDLYLGTKGGTIYKRELKELPLSLSIKNIDASNTVVCEGDPCILTARVIGGKPPYLYKWSDGSVSPSITVIPLETTKYKLAVTDASFKTATYDLTIRVNPIPAAPVITMSGDTLISNYISGNIWMIDDEVIGYETSNKFLPWRNGHFSVRVSQGGCLSDISNEIILDVNKIDDTNAVKIFPNPASDIINIEINEVIGNSVFSILTTQGQEIIRQTMIARETTIDISDLPPGIYLTKVEDNKFVTVKKIFKK